MSLWIVNRENEYELTKCRANASEVISSVLTVIMSLAVSARHEYTVHTGLSPESTHKYSNCTPVAFC